MHGTTMIFLALMPLSTGFINFAVPLLIGSDPGTSPPTGIISEVVPTRARTPSTCRSRPTGRFGSRRACSSW
jgi:hypothetical protein